MPKNNFKILYFVIFPVFSDLEHLLEVKIVIKRLRDNLESDEGAGAVTREQVTQAAAFPLPVHRAKHLPVAGVLGHRVQREHAPEVVPGPAAQNRELPQADRGRSCGSPP